MSEWNEYILDLSEIKFIHIFSSFLYYVPQNTVPYIGIIARELNPNYEYVIDTPAENTNLRIIKWRKINDKVECGYEDAKTLGCSPIEVKLKAMIDFVDNSENPKLEVDRLIEMLKMNESPWLHPNPYMAALWDIMLIRKATGEFPQ